MQATTTTSIPTESTIMSTSTTTTPSEPRVGFMSLPLELRFQIYSHLLSIPPHSKSVSHDLLCCNSEAPDYVYPAILLANRQINWEATPFLYSSNVFIAHPSLLASFPRLRNWYPPMREANVLVPLIHRFHVQVPLDLELPYDRNAAAKSFSGVDELSIDLVQSSFLGVSCNNLAVFDEVRGVKKVHVGGSTTGFESYIAWLKSAMTSPIGAEVVPFEVEAESPWAYIWNTHSGLMRSSLVQVDKEE